MVTQLLTVDITASSQTKVDAIINAIAKGINVTGTKAEKIDAINQALADHVQNLYKSGDMRVLMDAGKSARETEMSNIKKG